MSYVADTEVRKLLVVASTSNVLELSFRPGPNIWALVSADSATSLGFVQYNLYRVRLDDVF